MTKAFHTPSTRGEVIKAGRELVASKGLFITKKRYAVLYYDVEGKRTDIEGKEGNMKAMGLDLKRSDTPVFVQDFLSEILYMVLTGKEEKTFMKLIVQRSSDLVLGVHMVGPDAGELIQGMAVALIAGATKSQFDATVGIHPTAAEEFVTMRSISRTA